jgi:hypothetical protein
MAYTQRADRTTHSTGANNQKVYISYAWADRTPEGQRRGQLVEDLCTAMKSNGIAIRRDREQISPGDRISSFMQEIAKGDVIIVVLSNHYLESEYCMYELYGIWKQVRQDPTFFLKRVIPLTLPDANLRTLGDRIARAQYWHKEKCRLDNLIHVERVPIGEIAYSKYRLIEAFASDTADILELLTDKYEPRDFDRQAQAGFREVLDQILVSRLSGIGERYIHDTQRSSRECLLSLSRVYQDAGADLLKSAIARALATCFPGVSPAQVYPPVFSLGPVESWTDLLTRVENNGIVFDQYFLDTFEQGLKVPFHDKEESRKISSLLVMILRPRNLPRGEKCKAFAYRAYFCKDEDTPAEEWIRIDAKSADLPIRSANWSADLQRLLANDIGSAKLMLPSDQSDIRMLEIFLPTELLNEDIGSLVAFPLPMGGAGPLHDYYPFVLRSSQRFQIFQEGQEQLLFPNPLPPRWEVLKQADHPSRSLCYWLHDVTPASRSHSSQALRDLKQCFNRLRTKQEYFGLKRIKDLPSCPRLLNEWMEQMVWASPAVALWWRPMGHNSMKRRIESLQFSCPDSGPNPFGCSAPSDNDVFSLLPTHAPLKLFFALASTLFHGQFEEQSQALRDAALLVDSSDRWPRPVDHAPSVTPTPGEEGGVRNVPGEEILMSP